MVALLMNRPVEITALLVIGVVENVRAAPRASASSLIQSTS